MKIRPAKFLRGEITLPGDKSISHRAAILASMATGETRIENYATGADCASTLDCLRRLGVEIRRENTTVFIKSVGKTGFQKPSKDLDCGNSGTTVRLLAGVLAGQNFDAVLTGDESLRQRPMRRIIEPLRLTGARIKSENDYKAPLKIRGVNSLDAIRYELPIASAQVKSCVLLAGLNAKGKTIVVEKSTSGNGFANARDHTERMLASLGASIEIESDANDFSRTISLEGGAELKARDIKIPGDISSAAFFLAAAVGLPESDLTIKGVGLNETRTNFLDVLRECAPSIETKNEREICNETVGDIRVRGASFSNDFEFILSPDRVPAMIDELPILAVLGTRLWRSLEVRGARELRVKESDRIAATVENLKKMNACVREFDDGFRVEKSELKGAKINSFGDHRIAMAFAVAALFATGETEVTDADCAAISFPEFFEILGRITKA